MMILQRSLRIKFKYECHFHNQGLKTDPLILNSPLCYTNLKIPDWAIRETMTTEVFNNSSNHGFRPTFLTSFSWYQPIDANAIDIKNFDAKDILVIIFAGIRSMVLMPTTVRKPRINQGNILYKLIFRCLGRLFFWHIHEKHNGHNKSVLVSLTIVARIRRIGKCVPRRNNRRCIIYRSSTQSP